MLRAFGRILTLALSNFRRNLWLSVATVTVMVLAIGTYHVVVLLRVATDAALATIERKIDIGVYLASAVSEQSARALKTRLEKLPDVAEIDFISKADALSLFKAQRAQSEAITRALAEVGGNPFGAQLKIRAKTAEQYPAIIEALDDPAIVPKGTIERKSYEDHRALIERFTLYSNKAQRLIQILALALLLISFFVVLNTVRIAIYTHREEIGIMKLVGASNWFVRAPLLAEGVLYSIVATAIAMAVLLILLFALTPSLDRFFADVPVDFIGFYRTNALSVIGGQFLALSAVNALGAGIAIGRYLKV